MGSWETQKIPKKFGNYDVGWFEYKNRTWTKLKLGTGITLSYAYLQTLVNGTSLATIDWDSDKCITIFDDSDATGWWCKLAYYKASSSVGYLCLRYYNVKTEKYVVKDNIWNMEATWAVNGYPWTLYPCNLVYYNGAYGIGDVNIGVGQCGSPFMVMYSATTNEYLYAWNTPTGTYSFDTMLDEVLGNVAIYPWDYDDSTSGGGGGDSDTSSDNITIPSLPSFSLVNTLFKAYQVSTAQLSSLATKLWSDDFFDNILKINGDPMQNIISCHLMPITSSMVGTGNIKIGNYDTEVSSAPLTNDYVELNCGSIDISEFWGNALDYTNTKLQLYLPFVGTVNLTPNDVMDGSIQVVYHINMVNGGFTCFVKSYNDYHNSVLYQYGGNMAMEIPLSSRNYCEQYKQLFTNALGGLITQTPSSVAGVVGSALNTLSPTVERAGGLSQNNAYLGELTPYLIIERPIQQKPADYWKYVGAPSYITEELENISGYTEVENIYLNGVVATDTEKEELLRILKEGIYIVPSN